MPTGPDVGVKLLMKGLTLKALADWADPPGVVTEILPVVASDGTVAVICVSLSTVNKAEAPLNETSVAPVNRWPVSVTDDPTLPAFGLKLLITGPASTVKT